MSRALILLIAVVVFGLTAPASHAATFTGPRAQWLTWWEAVGKVPGPSGAIELRKGPCPSSNALGCADIDDGELWLATNKLFAAEHELGHFFDARNLDDEEREQLQFRMGIRLDIPWENPRVFGDGCGVDQCPSEMFADAYANCALGRSPAGHHRAHGRITGGWESPYGYAPSASQHRTICATIRAFA
jgi:hypothetical protein